MGMRKSFQLRIGTRLNWLFNALSGDKGSRCRWIMERTSIPASKLISMFPNITRDYLFASLRESPGLIARELLPKGDLRWDRRVWEERFTAREVCAHLADQEEIFQTRF